MVGVGEGRLAVMAAHRLDDDPLVRFGGERPPAALAAQAALARALPLSLLRPVQLLPLRRRQAGVVRGLARPGQVINARSQLGNQLVSLVQTRHQRQDQRVLLGVGKSAQLKVGAHPDLEPSRPSPRQGQFPSPITGRVEQLRVSRVSAVSPSMSSPPPCRYRPRVFTDAQGHGLAPPDAIRGDPRLYC